MSDKITEGSRFHNTDRGIVSTPRREQPNHGRSYSEIEASKKNRNKWLRRALLTGTAALALTQTPIPGATADYLSGIGEDRNKPQATEANMGGTSIINLTEVKLKTGHTVIWPVLRENPEVHNGKDGTNLNIVSWDDVNTINNAPIDVEPGKDLIITINNPTFVLGGNPDNATLGAPQGLWEVVEVVKKDGTRETDYISVSGNTESFVELNLSGLMTPIDQQNGNDLSDKLNITEVITKP